MDATPQKFDTWAIVEAMGFKKLAGHVTEQTIGGASLLRVDVPQTSDDHPAYCKLIGVGSIYMITPCDEATARKAARVLEQSNDPIPVYIPPERPRLTATAGTQGPWRDGDDTDAPDPSLPF